MLKYDAFFFHILFSQVPDDTVMMSRTNPEPASAFLQAYLDRLSEWLSGGRIAVNGSKSKHVTVTLTKGDCSPITV